MPGENPFRTARTRVIAVASGKGGVGKSSVTANLSVALARMGKDVAAIDADVWGFSMPRMLGVENGPELTDENLMIPPSGHGVRLLSMGFFVPEDQAVIWRGPMLHKALEQFLTDVAWGEPDYLVIDMPPGTGDVSLSMSQFLPRAEVVIVTTPQPAAQAVAQRAAAMAEKVELDVIGVVENMSWFRGDDGTRYEIFGCRWRRGARDPARCAAARERAPRPRAARGGRYRHADRGERARVRGRDRVRLHRRAGRRDQAVEDLPLRAVDQILSGPDVSARARAPPGPETPAPDRERSAQYQFPTPSRADRASRGLRAPLGPKAPARDLRRSARLPQ